LATVRDKISETKFIKVGGNRRSKTDAAEFVLDDAEAFHNGIGRQQKSLWLCAMSAPPTLTSRVPTVRTAQTVDMQIRN
jgi:hypothetical protein